MTATTSRTLSTDSVDAGLPAVSMRVPFVDLRALHDEQRPMIMQALLDVIDESAFVGGRHVVEFETAFARYSGAPHAIGVASGTDALILALRGIGVTAGDVVITVPNTFMATVEAIVQAGAAPRFVDVDASTRNLDPDLLQEYLTDHCQRDAGGTVREKGTGRRVAAVIPVHLYGLMADMPRITAIADDFGIEVIEDACQAHGAQVHDSGHGWRGAGTIGRAGCFSFYPGKNLGALGDAGAIVTGDGDLAARMRVLRDHGQRERYLHVSADGINGRLDGLQAAALRVKLDKLDEWNDRRRAVAGWYGDALGDVQLCRPCEPEGWRHVYHLYAIQVPRRDEVRAALQKHGIETGLHYPIPLHLQPGLDHLGLSAGSYPVSESLARSTLSLPMHPHLTEEQVQYVCEALRAATERNQGEDIRGLAAS
jgi:dTDP-4-amino-4,6-dideoxygalactose transaminase